MKQIVCFLFITIGMYTNSLNAQEIIWLDNSFVETTQDKADYYRINVKLEGEISLSITKKELFLEKFFIAKTSPMDFFMSIMKQANSRKLVFMKMVYE